MPPDPFRLRRRPGNEVRFMRVCVDLPLGRCKGTHSDVLTVSASAHFHNLQLQKSPSRVFGQNSGNSVDISKAFFEMGVWKFESSQVSQAVAQLEIAGLVIR